MLKVECESCRAPYQIDERRVPPAGLKMRCPKCGHSFVVRAGGPDAALPPTAPPPANAPSSPAPPAPTAPRAPAVPRAAPRPPAAPPVAPRPPPKPTPMPPARAGALAMGLSSGADAERPAMGSDLPARPPGPAVVRRTMAGVAAPGGPPAPRIVKVGPGAPSAAPPSAAPRVAKPAPLGPDLGLDLPPLATPRPPPIAAPEDADLPAIAADLPATRAQVAGAARPAPKPAQAAPKAAQSAPKPAPEPAPKPLAGSALKPVGGPAPISAKARTKQTLPFGPGPFALPGDDEVPTPADDLPVAAAVGLPSPAAVGLPATARGGPPPARQPAPAAAGKRKQTLEMGFGEIDLPSPQSDLPAVQTAALPAVQAGLPAVQAGLPAVPAALPSVQPSLPAVADALPEPLADERQMPGRITDGRHLPASLSSAGDDSLPPAFGADDFGDLELPRPPTSPAFAVPAPAFAAPPRPRESTGDVGFGELELPVPPEEPAGPPPPPASERAGGGAGGVGFGELDLGGSGPAIDTSLDDDPFSDAPVRADDAHPPPVAPASLDTPPASQQVASLSEIAIGRHVSGPPGEASLDVASAPRRARPVEAPRSSSALPKVLGVLAALGIAGGGGALELTPHGAFFRNTIYDATHAAELDRAATDAVGALHRGLAPDAYAEARAAASELARLHAAKPRARALTAVAALGELEVESRFGADPALSSRAKVWLSHDIPEPRVGVRYLDVAQAAAAAVDFDLPNARAALDAAAAKYASDPVLADVLFLRGELEYRAKDGAAMATAYTRALAAAPGARAHFGLARAAYLQKDFKTAKDEVDATLKESPAHGDALLLRAQIAWTLGHDDASAESALNDLAAVLEGPAKGKLGDRDVAEAFATRGWIELVRGRSAEARAAFDAAVTKDARNVRALAGQGEVLYQEGRYTEAITRYDTALSADADSLVARVGSAKTKIQLEKLAEAKTQLQDTVKRFPKAASPLQWLGQAESALGNLAGAEKDFVAALALVDPKDPEAVEPYASLASFLSAQGRPEEAAARLEEARKKLPDSATLQRALGDVAVARGSFDEAIAHYRAAIQLDPKDVSSRFRLGQALRKSNRLADAGKAFDDVERLDPSYPSLSLERGLLFEQSGDVPRALEAFKAALAKAPGDPDLQLRVGAAYVTIGKPEDALEMLKKVLLARPNGAEAEHFLGRAYMEMGPLNYQQAMHHLVVARDRDDNHSEYHLYIGWLANLESPPEPALARKEIARALELDQTSADAYWQRGVLAYMTGGNKDAERDLRRALQLKPTRYEAHATLARVYEQMNRVGDAVNEWRIAFQRKPDDELWNKDFGLLLYKNGMYAEAVKHLKLASEAASKDAPHPGWWKVVEFPCAEAMRRTGDTKGAIEHYQAFIEQGDENDPDRVEALARLRQLGAPYQPSR